MDAYWILEYGKVFCGYVFLMFLWPTVVFWKYLQGKSRIYHFSFCVTVQIALINTVVLMMGLFHILDGRLVAGLFYGLFLLSAVRRIKDRQIRTVLFEIKKRKKAENCTGIQEYILLFSVVVFGVIYFSYGAFQVHCYGQTDLMVHHQWINHLVQGQIFSGGVYPEGMHCFIYCLHILFGIRIYSLMLFLQGIHVMVFLLSAYSLLREIFCWRYSPIFVLGFYLMLNITVMTCEYSIYRLQMTLPMEFGLHTQFLCALYLIRYLKNAGQIQRKERLSKWCWDENLFLFIMSLTASVMIHYYTTIMAFIICLSFALFHMGRIVQPKYMIPLAVSVVCGCILAGIPMAGGLISGIPFEGSINWGLKSISSNNDNNEKETGNGQEQGIEETEITRKPLELTNEDVEIIERLPSAGQKIAVVVIKAEYFIREIFKRGYQGMYGEKRGRRIFVITVAVIAICLIGRVRACGRMKKISDGYSPMILASLLFMVVYLAYESPSLGLPVLVAGNRACSSTHMIVLAVMMIPADILFSFMTAICRERFLQTVSVFVTMGIYVFTNLCGIFHGYLYYSLTRYDCTVTVTDSIIKEFPRDSYTIVSPYEELCQVYLYGGHEELPDFIENCENDYYSIPTEYVFIYVEKRPIIYRQSYYFSGPAWLAKSGNSVIESTRISDEAAKEDISGYTRSALYREGRIILESKVYEWCQRFAQQYPLVLNIYYEDEDFVCFYFRQDMDVLYNLAGDR